MNCRLRLRYNLPKKAAECPHDPKPALHLRRSDCVRNHLIRPGQTQIKLLATRIGSVKSRHRRPLGDQVASRSAELTKTIIRGGVMYNFVRNDVYSAYKPRAPRVHCVQTWTIIAGARSTRVDILSRLKNWRLRSKDNWTKTSIVVFLLVVVACTVPHST